MSSSSTSSINTNTNAINNAHQGAGTVAAGTGAAAAAAAAAATGASSSQSYNNQAGGGGYQGRSNYHSGQKYSKNRNTASYKPALSSNKYYSPASKDHGYSNYHQSNANMKRGDNYYQSSNTNNTSNDDTTYNKGGASVERKTEGIYKNQRLANASNTILGCPVLLKVKSNDTYHGIFVTYSPEFDVVLECCHKVDPANEVVVCGRSIPKASQVKARFFERDDIVEMIAQDVDIDFALKSAESNFTDAAIAQKVVKGKDASSSGGHDLSDCGGKELEPFSFETDDLDMHHNSTNSAGGLDLDDPANAMSQQLNYLELDSGVGGDSSSNGGGGSGSGSGGGGGGGGWCAEDMLMVNQTKYGYKSTYNSDLNEYTLAVEKEDTEEFRRREEEAEKMAQEIESSTTYRRNVDKELSDNEEEEEKFSAVVRPHGKAHKNRRMFIKHQNENPTRNGPQTPKLPARGSKPQKQARAKNSDSSLNQSSNSYDDHTEPPQTVHNGPKARGQGRSKFLNF